jgi:ribosome modulation factor
LSHSDRKQRSCRQEGAAARAAGRPIDACPYHSRVSAREAWEEGWRSADPAPARSHHDAAESPVAQHSRMDY